VSSEESKDQGHWTMALQDQARPWMLPGGEVRRELGIDEHICIKRRFHQAFDE
jgi:hypothetical protein